MMHSMQHITGVLRGRPPCSPGPPRLVSRVGQPHHRLSHRSHHLRRFFSRVAPQRRVRSYARMEDGPECAEGRQRLSLGECDRNEYGPPRRAHFGHRQNGQGVRLLHSPRMPVPMHSLQSGSCHDGVDHSQDIGNGVMASPPCGSRSSRGHPLTCALSHVQRGDGE